MVKSDVVVHPSFLRQVTVSSMKNNAGFFHGEDQYILLGVGYHLILSKDVHSNGQEIFQLVQNHIPRAQLESAISAECKILLPHDASGKFADLFDDLEKRKAELNIFGIGLSETTIEEVFMKM